MLIRLIILLAAFAAAHNLDTAIDRYQAGQYAFAAVWLVTAILEAAIVWKAAQRIR